MVKRKRRAPVRSRVRTRTITKKIPARRRKTTTNANPRNAVIGGFAYGLVRGKVASLISPVTSKIPMGQYADELGMGLLSWWIAKGKVKMIPKHIGVAGLAIESFVVGQDVGAGNFNMGTAMPSNTNKGFSF